MRVCLYHPIPSIKHTLDSTSGNALWSASAPDRRNLWRNGFSAHCFSQRESTNKLWIPRKRSGWEPRVRFAQIPARLVWLQIILMQPSNFAKPFSNPAWIFEPKWDGFRALCYLDGERIRFISRRKNELTKRFPELQTIQVKAESAIIDGEITAIDDQGLRCTL